MTRVVDAWDEGYEAGRDDRRLKPPPRESIVTAPAVLVGAALLSAHSGVTQAQSASEPSVSPSEGRSDLERVAVGTSGLGCNVLYQCGSRRSLLAMSA